MAASLARGDRVVFPHLPGAQNGYRRELPQQLNDIPLNLTLNLCVQLCH
jgi:hypothetical protein